MAYTTQSPVIAEKIKRDQRALVNLGHVHSHTKWTHFGNLGDIPANQSGVSTRLDGSDYGSKIQGALLQLYNFKWMTAAPKLSQTGKTNKAGTYRTGPSTDYAASGDYAKGQTVATSLVGSTYYMLTNKKFILKADVGSAFDPAVFAKVFNEALPAAIAYAVGEGAAKPPDIPTLLNAVKLRLVQLIAGDNRIKAMGIGA
jgi:hypothetical protein